MSNAYYRARIKIISDEANLHDSQENKALQNGYIPPNLQKSLDERINFLVKYHKENHDKNFDAPLSTAELMTYGTWFAMHPEKVAGTPTMSTDYKNVVKYKGSRSDVEKCLQQGIDAKIITSTQSLVDTQEDDYDDGTISEYKLKKEFDFGFVHVNPLFTPEQKNDCLQRIYDCFARFADALGIPHSKMGLNRCVNVGVGVETLDLSTAAFYRYEDHQMIFRDKSFSSIAHEWFHAVDHYLGYKFISKDSKVYSENVNKFNFSGSKELQKAFDTILQSIFKSQYYKDVRSLTKNDKGKYGADYYQEPTELGARAMEVYTALCIERNKMPMDKISRTITSKSTHQFTKSVYPDSERDKDIMVAFDNFFKLL